MHELSLAQGLIDELHSLAKEHKAERILRLTVTIGAFSGIVADSFVFGFDALKLEYPLIRAAVLEIEVPLPSYSCPACGNIQVMEMAEEDHVFGLPGRGLASAGKPCSACGSARLLPQGGDELILKQVEME